MTADEFNETYALCHFLPGPNVVNLSVVFGSRFRGPLGGMAAFAGLLGPPVVIVTILAALYARFRSRKDHTFAEKILSAMRAGFGGHREPQQPASTKPKA